MTETYWEKKESQDLFDEAIKLEGQGKTSEAISLYQKSLKANPKNAQTLYNLGIAYATLEKVDQAISCWRRAIWLDPSFRDELVKAFAIDDDMSETLLSEDFIAYDCYKAA